MESTRSKIKYEIERSQNKRRMQMILGMVRWGPDVAGVQASPSLEEVLGAVIAGSSSGLLKVASNKSASW